jgi:hypothetical protein
MSKLLSAFFFWGFILVKGWGTIFAAWSWWWVLLPFVPWVSYALLRAGLL